ncbi:MAG: 30S ribosome-binding factor RbfA, partial [Gammaproteobacteria bacterium]|nr:30S ribosome-binding factor RbfA [Gammaproteobacteria bacterium]
LITITKVDVSRDLRHAKVYVTGLGESSENSQAAAALNHAAGFLRRQLSHMLDLKNCPALRFEYDDSVEKSVSLSALIDQCVAHDDKSGDS